MALESIGFQTNKLQHLKTGFIDFTAGSLGGIALVYVGQPLDTVKVKMQTFPSMYNGMVDCFTKTFKADGLARGLYAGTVPAIVANVAENSVLFAAYGGCQTAIARLIGKPDIKSLNSFDNACAGFCAAFFSSLTLCPTELVKCRLQAMREVQSQQGNVTRHIGPWTLTKSIIRENGFLGLFRGLSSTIAREMPGYFFFFGGYELTRGFLAKPGQSRDEIGPLKTMAAGAVGGTVLWLVIFPADVVKSRIQVQNLSEPAIGIMKQIARNEGISALYNGLKPTLVRTVPATATLFVTYEYTKKMLHSALD
ncbi:mitochondrial ornithine transporter 1 [Cotesia glomerata]|nr:mitochondrial ornithine transporter 1 [Cotesia glomerata]